MELLCMKGLILYGLQVMCLSCAIQRHALKPLEACLPSDESLEQGQNRSRELHFTAEQPDKPDLASVGNSLASGPPPPPPPHV